MCLVFFPLECLLFFSSNMALMLPWYMIFLVTSYPCSIKNILTHRIGGITLFTAMSLASVELRLLIFCFDETLIGHPRPMLIHAPVWLFISLCTAKDASTHHLITPSGRPLTFFNIRERKRLKIIALQFQLQSLWAFCYVCSGSLHGLFARDQTEEQKKKQGQELGTANGTTKVRAKLSFLSSHVLLSSCVPKQLSWAKTMALRLR